MNVKMKGSAAFIGGFYAFPKHIEDIFDFRPSAQATILPPESREEGS